MNSFSSLPLEISLDILSRLPIESILECKSVCRSWGNLVLHPLFSKMHLHRLNHPSTADDSGKLGFLASTSKKYRDYDNLEFTYVEYNKNHDSETCIERTRRVNLKPPFGRNTSIVGTYNGLLCLTGSPSVCICNPITREYIMLPQIKTKDCDTHQYMWTHGFGYLSLTNKYKVVAVHASSQPEFIEVHIYTLGSPSGWRNLGRFNFDLCQSDYASLPQGIFANGSLYWIGGYNLQTIFTFDLADEKFCEHLSPPPLPPNGHWPYNIIGVLDGCLYIAVWRRVEGDEGDGDEREWYDIWLLTKKNDNHGMKERKGYQALVWTKEFSLEESNLVAFTKSGGVLTSMFHLNIYDPKSSTPKRVMDFKECFIREIFPHKNTLVSLKELGEEDTEIMESIEIEKTESRVTPLEQPEEVEALDTLLSLKELRGKDKEIMGSVEIKETQSRDLLLEQPEEDEALDT